MFLILKRSNFHWSTLFAKDFTFDGFSNISLHVKGDSYDYLICGFNNLKNVISFPYNLQLVLTPVHFREPLNGV